MKSLNAKRKYFDAYNSNEPLVINEDHIKEISPKYEVDKFNAANSNIPKGSCVQKRYEKVEVEWSDCFNPNQNVCASYLWKEKETEDKNEPMILNAHGDNYNRMWFKEGRFPINIHGES